MDTVYILGVLHIPTRHKSKGKVCYYRMWVCLLAMYNGRIGWGFLFGGILLNFCCCVFVCACFELSICLLGSSSNKNRCWLKHLGSRRTPTVPYRPWFSIFQHGKKTFRSRFTRKWTRNRIVEEDVPLWRIHFSRASLRRAPAMPPAMPSWLSTATKASSGGKTLRQDTKRSGTIRFLRKHVQMERRGFSKCWAGSSLQVYDKFVKDIVGEDFRRSVPQWTDRALEQDDFEGVLSPMGIRRISPWRSGRGMALTVLWRLLKSCIRRFWVGTTSRAPVWTVYFCKLAVNPLRCCAYTRQIEEHAVHMCSPEERRGVCNYMKAFSPPIQELICAFCFSFERICLQGFATTMAKLVDPGDSCHREKAFRKLSLCECIVQRKKGTKTDAFCMQQVKNHSSR